MNCKNNHYLLFSIKAISFISLYPSLLMSKAMELTIKKRILFSTWVLWKTIKKGDRRNHHSISPFHMFSYYSHFSCAFTFPIRRFKSPLSSFHTRLPIKQLFLLYIVIKDGNEYCLPLYSGRYQIINKRAITSSEKMVPYNQIVNIGFTHMIILLPSLYWLYWFFMSREKASDNHRTNSN